MCKPLAGTNILLKVGASGPRGPSSDDGSQKTFVWCSNQGWESAGGGPCRVFNTAIFQKKCPYCGIGTSPNTNDFSTGISTFPKQMRPLFVFICNMPQSPMNMEDRAGLLMQICTFLHYQNFSNPSHCIDQFLFCIHIFSLHCCTSS
jgi:hypothetical protein